MSLRFERALDFARGVALGNGFAFVVLAFAFDQRDFNFGAIFFRYTRNGTIVKPFSWARPIKRLISLRCIKSLRVRYGSTLKRLPCSYGEM